MKTTRKKNRSMEFVALQDHEIKDLLGPYQEDMDLPALCDGETFGVKGRFHQDYVGLVSLISRRDGDWEALIITQLYIFPPFRDFGIGTQILEALSSTEGVTFIRVIATPHTAPYYEDRGFERDAGHIILTKVILNE